MPFAVHCLARFVFAGGALLAISTIAFSADSSHLYTPLDERGLQRQQDERLAAQAQRDREQRAAEEERQRIQRRQRSQAVIDGVTGGCIIKPVMTDAERAACSR